MDPDTINPRLLLSMPMLMNAETAYSLPSTPGSAIDHMDYGDISLDDMDFGMAKSGLMQSASIDFSTVESDLMDFDSMHFGSVDFGTVDLGDVVAAPKDSGNFGYRSTDALPSGSDIRDSGTILDQGTENDMTDINPPGNKIMDGAMRRHDLTTLSYLKLNTRSTRIQGPPQTYRSNRTLQPRVQGQIGGMNEEDYTQDLRSTTFANPTWPRQIYFLGSAARRTITLDDRREYRPKCFDDSANSAKITADDWEEYRPFVKQLYIVENAKLKDVMKILETKFGFVASEKMYKTKIRQWGFMKNYKADEKEQLARIVKSHHDSGNAIPQLTLRNRPAKMDRIRRFCKQEKILEEICDALPFESSSSTKVASSTESTTGTHQAAKAGLIASALQGIQKSSISSVPTLETISFDPERPFSSTSKDGRIELVLLQVKIYQESRRPSTIYSSSLEGPSFLNGSDKVEIYRYVSGWARKLAYGVSVLAQQKSAEGWRSLDEACGMIHRILDQQAEALLRLLFHALGDGDWTRCPGLSTHFLRFFTKVSVTKLGCNHPLSIILYHLQEQQLFADAERPTLEVLMDVYGENSDPMNNEVWMLKDNYCGMLTDRGDYAAAESHSLRFLKQSEEVSGRLNWRTRSLLYGIGRIHHNEGLNELAEAEFQDVLQRGREDLGDEFPDMDCIVVLRDLAGICGARGDFAQSEEYWRAAIGGALKEWGLEYETTTWFVIQLEEAFKNQGKDPEAWLQQNFGISCV